MVLACMQFSSRKKINYEDIKSRLNSVLAKDILSGEIAIVIRIFMDQIICILYNNK